MINVKQTKIMVKDSYESIKVQEKLFKLGVFWLGGEKNKKIPEYVNQRFLYVSGHSTLGYGDETYFFENHGYKEIKVSDLLKPNSLKQFLKNGVNDGI